MQPRTTRTRAVTATLVAVAVMVTLVVGVLLTSTSGDGDGDAAAGDAAEDSGGDRDDGAGEEGDDAADVELSALRGDPAADGLPEPLVDLDRIISGGPPPDGIPPIDDPSFVPVPEVDYLADDEPVVAVSVDGDSRAYPIQVLTWHEIVNDTVGDVPVTVTYCPLCNSALAFDRRLDGEVLDFGTSGRLYLSNLVMYDRQTESLWPQAEGQAVAGVLTGQRLERVPAAMVPWGTWRDANPDGQVLSRDTGFDRDYGRNPYVGYDEVGSDPFLFDGESDARLEAMERVVTFGEPEDPVAVRTATLLADGVVEVPLATSDVDGTVVVLGAPGQASALDTEEIVDGRDVGTTGVFVPRAGGTTVTLAPAGPGDGLFTDAETGSTWTVLGEAVDGPLTGERLERVPSVDTFWFTWAAFQPDTRLEG